MSEISTLTRSLNVIQGEILEAAAGIFFCANMPITESSRSKLGGAAYGLERATRRIRLVVLGQEEYPDHHAVMEAVKRGVFNDKPPLPAPSSPAPGSDDVPAMFITEQAALDTLAEVLIPLKEQAKSSIVRELLHEIEEGFKRELAKQAG